MTTDTKPGRRRIGSLTTALLIVVLSASPAFGAKGVKMGFVDIQRIIAASPAVREARAEAQRGLDGSRAKLEVEQRAIEKLQQDYQRDKAIMSDSQRQAREQDIRDKLQAYARLNAQLQQQVRQQQAALADRALGPVQNLIADVAKERGLDVVFERQQSALLYVEPALDLTDEVIERIQAGSR